MTHRLLLIIIATIVAVGCTFPNVVSPYKLDIPQGNAITADQVAKLKPGLTRSQVRFILGTPLLTDPFHAERWDYIYTDAKNSKLSQKKTFTVFFDQDKLSRFEGESFPAVTILPLLEESKIAVHASASATQKD